MIRLITPYYVDSNHKRQQEIEQCREKNKANSLINEYHNIERAERLDFAELFRVANNLITNADDITIIANSDIYFNETIRLCEQIKENECYALSRWDETHRGLNLYNHADSQDVWIFRGTIKPIKEGVIMGKPGCDNILAFELTQLGYKVINPSLSIQAIHVHTTRIRNYTESDRLFGTYLTIQPSSLSGESSIRKVLHIALNDQGKRQEALCLALQSLGEYLEIDWMHQLQRIGLARLRRLIIDTARNFQPDLIFFQIQQSGVIDSQTLNSLPGYKVNWCGDVRDPFPAWYIEMGRYFNLSLFTNGKDIETMRANGCNAGFLQIGFNEKVFNINRKNPPEIVFMGSHYGNTFPLSQLRHDMVHTLTKKYGERFAVYGNQWDIPTMSLMYNEPAEAMAYNSCKIAINCSHFDLSRYSSDRIFRIMGSGAFCLTKWYPDIEMDFEDGNHLVVWKDISDLLTKIEYYLKHEKEREQIAQSGYELVHSRDTWQHRIDELKTMII